MKMSHKLHEWLADRVTWIQYPRLRPADEFTKQASRTGRSHPRHAVKVPSLMPILLGLMGIVSMLIGFAVLSGVALFVYLLLRALFKTG